jgi:hypothetical protein
MGSNRFKAKNVGFTISAEHSKAVGSLEDVADLFRLCLGNGFDLVFLDGPFVGVVLGVATGGKVATETHRDGACGNLGKACRDNQVGLGNGPSKASRESEGNGQAVGHADDDVADSVACREVLLNVWRHWHGL